MLLTPIQVAEFRQIILNYYYEYGRHDLPWRTTHTAPYHIMISEFMLQQTGVERVIPKFLNFVTTFPTLHDLASAPQSTVITHWIGLGYNRRAVYLHHAANLIVERYNSIVPSTPDELQSLPGIGHYASAAIAAYAYNHPSLVIDTNIRTIYIHHFFNDRNHISDKELIPIIEQTLDYANPRIWYSALMDYGTYLKKTVGNISKRSKHYTRQSPLRGSRRELRGAVLKLLVNGPLSLTKMINRLKKAYPHNTHDMQDIVKDLLDEHIITDTTDTLSLQ